MSHEILHIYCLNDFNVCALQVFMQTHCNGEYKLLQNNSNMISFTVVNTSTFHALVMFFFKAIYEFSYKGTASSGQRLIYSLIWKFVQGQTNGRHSLDRECSQCKTAAQIYLSAASLYHWLVLQLVNIIQSYDSLNCRI